MNNKEIADRIFEVSNELEDILYDLRKNELDLDEPAGTLDEWKKIVLRILPKGTSLAFRIKVEDFFQTLD